MIDVTHYQLTDFNIFIVIRGPVLMIRHTWHTLKEALHKGLKQMF